jgi:hypothetical protein
VVDRERLGTDFTCQQFALDADPWTTSSLYLRNSARGGNPHGQNRERARRLVCGTKTTITDDPIEPSDETPDRSAQGNP